MARPDAFRIAAGLAVMAMLTGTAAAGLDVKLKPAAFTDLQGWQSDGIAKAIPVFQRSCREILKFARGFKRHPLAAGTMRDWQAVCRASLKLDQVTTDTAARRFFEQHFVPVKVSSKSGTSGLFTGYFEPEVRGSLVRTEDYTVPVYARPSDLVAFNRQQRRQTGLSYGRIVKGKPKSYLTRRQIEQGGLGDRSKVLVWLASYPDAFFMQIQGSGSVRLTDGTRLRLAFAAKTGLAYTPIGRILIDRGEIAREDMSMQAIRAWLDANPAKTRELLWQNQSFVFFRKVELEDPSLGPVGGQQVQLTPLRSLAIDRRYWVYGTPLWLETAVPDGKAAHLTPFRQLMIAQDTGSAIRGAVRGDIFFGSGRAAGEIAGRMQSEGSFHALLPLAVIRRLGLKVPAR